MTRRGMGRSHRNVAAGKPVHANGMESVPTKQSTKCSLTMYVPRLFWNSTDRRLLQPSTMDQTGVESDYCHSNYGPDCTHWSETGVVEEWNALLLNHICPVNA